MQCKFCHQDRKLIRAHVIPRSFFEIDPTDLPRLASTKDGIFPKRAPAGIYDQQLVCECCERLFSPFDDYANNLLIANRDATKSINVGKQSIAYVYEEYEYRKLKLFFMSLLWRASQSSHNFFRNISLARHESRIRQAVIQSDAGNSEFYSVLLTKFPRPNGILDPHNTRFSGVNFCQFYLAEYVAYIKVDTRSLPESFQGLELKDRGSLVLLARDPAKSKDTEVMRSIALKNQKLIHRK
jgi:hypothetical protein